MTWKLQTTRDVQKLLRKFPAKDRERIVNAFKKLENNPFGGDIVRLRKGKATWRLRVGSYRIFFDLYDSTLIVLVVAVERRTSTTY